MRWGQALGQHREREFVGRGAELRRFEAVVQGRTPAHFVYVDGPPGVGKTQLLHAFTRIVEARGWNVAWLEASALTPDALELEHALESALPPAMRGASGGTLLVIDGWERLAALEGWLRERVFPSLPHELLVAAAGRKRLGDAWRVDPGWSSEVIMISLRPFTRAEVAAYLIKRGLSGPVIDAIHEQSGGLPLIVAVLAEIALQRPGSTLRLDANPEVLGRLLSRFVEDVPSPAHALALQASAVAPRTTEGMLAELLGTSSAQGIYRWLSQIEFMQMSPTGGIVPHDAVRGVLEAGLRVHEPSLWRRLLGRVLRHYVDKLEREPSEADFAEMMALAGHVVRWARNDSDAGGLAVMPARPDDRAAIEAMIARHEGPEAVELARFWWARPGEWLVVADGEGVTGFAHMLDLASLNEEDIGRDPATATLRGLMQREQDTGALRALWLMRYWMACETYQAVSPVQTAIFNHVGARLRGAAVHPSHIVSCVRDREAWQGVIRGDSPQLLDLTFELGGRSYGYLARDLTRTSPTRWHMDFVRNTLAELEGQGPGAAARADASAGSECPSPSDTVTWNREVKAALRVLTQPDLLAASPLVGLAVVRRAAGEAWPRTRSEALARVLHEEVARFGGSPRDATSYGVLERAYLRPAVKMEAAADELGMGYSTFRRHLARAVDRLAANLAERERDLRARGDGPGS